MWRSTWSSRKNYSQTKPLHRHIQVITKKIREKQESWESIIHSADFGEGNSGHHGEDIKTCLILLHYFSHGTKAEVAKWRATNTANPRTLVKSSGSWQKGTKDFLFLREGRNTTWTQMYRWLWEVIGLLPWDGVGWELKPGKYNRACLHPQLPPCKRLTDSKHQNCAVFKKLIVMKTKLVHR